MAFFCRDEGEPLAEIKAHLPTEHRQGARASAVFFLHTVLQDVLDELQILSHADMTLAGHPCACEARINANRGGLGRVSLGRRHDPGCGI
ncbi:hypothetical protein QPK87_15880 [Kamptonema cortianum]|nr:hypothetical protein [Kamptonema cortianum]